MRSRAEKRPWRRVAALGLAASLACSGASAAERAARDPDDQSPVVLNEAAKASLAGPLKARTRKVVVLPFAVAWGPSANRRGLAGQSCPAAKADSQAEQPINDLEPKILDRLNTQLVKKLSRHAAVENITRVEAAPPAALIIAGCITRSEAGDPAKRMIGFHYGASRIAAHVRLVEKNRGRLTPVAEFDVSATGANLLPPLSPIGLAMHVAQIKRQRLIDGAKKLGNRISYAVEDLFWPGEG